MDGHEPAGNGKIAVTMIGGARLMPNKINGQAVVLDPAGAMYLPDCGVLCVSDLHLEKGAAFARRGQLLPPWDTLATLRILGA
jgi:hypothetical protein